MIVRRPQLPAPSALRQYVRCLHHQLPLRPIPKPTPFIPDPQAFLTVIGRGLSQHSAKIPTWDALFTLTSQQLRELGVEPARSRRYLLHWREKFRNGEYGVGGDLMQVQDGAGEIRVVEQPVAADKAGEFSKLATATKTPGTRKIVVNVPPGSSMPDVPLEQAQPVKFLKVKGAQTMSGAKIEAVKGSNGLAAKIRVKEGLWEEARGVKTDGGERRRAAVRAKKRAIEKRDAA